MDDREMYQHLMEIKAQNKHIIDLLETEIPEVDEEDEEELRTRKKFNVKERPETLRK